MVQELDLDMLLMSIHDYFMGLGVDEIRRRGAEDDKPLRMVKTILHELCKLKASVHQYTRTACAAPEVLDCSRLSSASAD